MSPTQPEVYQLDHLVLTVKDIAKTIAFYETVLGMHGEVFATADGTNRWALKFGHGKINLHQLGSEFQPNARQATIGSADLCFLTQTPLPVWQQHLENTATPVEEGPVPRTGATGPLVSLYVRDPDGNLIEIAVLAD